jgi:hypothetical protein
MWHFCIPYFQQIIHVKGQLHVKIGGGVFKLNYRDKSSFISQWI